jgi:hypothetical protein
MTSIVENILGNSIGAIAKSYNPIYATDVSMTYGAHLCY